MKTKIDMAVKPVRYATKPEHQVRWYRIGSRDHWVVLSPFTGEAVGEIFRFHGDRYYGLVYDRVYETKSGCVETKSLSGLVIMMTGVALNGAS